MNKKVLVVSDLHLGGAPATSSEPGFQIFPAEGQKRLAEFFDWATAQAAVDKSRKLHLVLNGDIVDFLAEADAGIFSALTTDEATASRKLESIFKFTGDVWAALGRYVASGSALILLLGNHDVELTLPLVRRRLLERLGGGQVEFLYDNEALTFGPVLIEHGNRYDAWNAVFHNQLRELRSALSRRIPAPDLPEVPTQPGSELVIQVMNDIKRRYAFVDLLKPERAGVMPLLAFLDPAIWLKSRAGIRALFRAALDRRTPAGDPKDRDKVSGFGADDAMFDLADSIAKGGHPDQVSGGEAEPSFVQRWRDATTAALKRQQLAALHRVLRALVTKHSLTFEIDHEDDEYLKPAQARVQAGFELVVFGHTHLAKRVELSVGSAQGRYLNTGTWVDLMRVPDAVFDTSESGILALESFAEALATNAIAPWRRRAPTYADIQLDGDKLVSADVFFFDGPRAQERLTTDGLLKRVGRE